MIDSSILHFCSGPGDMMLCGEMPILRSGNTFLMSFRGGNFRCPAGFPDSPPQFPISCQWGLSMAAGK